MSKVHIPETVEAAKRQLDGLGALLTAKEWERAAIVYAFTRDGARGPGAKPETRRTESLSVPEFATLGIAGLKSDTTVRDYRKAWQTAIEDGQAQPVGPGDDVETPDRAWPPNPKQHTTSASEKLSAFRAVVNDREQFREALRDQPETMARLAEHVATSPSLSALVVRDRTDRGLADASPAPRYEPDYSQDLRHAVNGLLRVLSAMRDGKWSPDEMETTLLHFLSQAFAELTEKENSYDVINEIEAFLVGQQR